MRLLIAFAGLMTCAMAFSQNKTHTYDFLNLTNSARIGALGGNQVALGGNDLNYVYHNPAALNKSLHNGVTFSMTPYVGGSRYAYVGYAYQFKEVGTFGLGIHNINYGSFESADEFGNRNGKFSAAEYAIYLSYSKALSPHFNIGATVKPVISNFEQYNSVGLVADIGVRYESPDSLFTFGATIKNVGSQLSTYNNTYESVPFDIQIGISKKLAHAPFRLSLTADHLLDWNTKYEVKDGNGDLIDDAGNAGNVLDQLMRHAVLGVEFMPSKNFFVGFGYNHRRRKELGVESKMSMTGFSWGFGLRIRKFHFSYGSARYHLGGTSNHFTLSTNIDAFK